jgi:hypothetical protein
LWSSTSCGTRQEAPLKRQSRKHSFARGKSGRSTQRFFQLFIGFYTKENMVKRANLPSHQNLQDGKECHPTKIPIFHGIPPCHLWW